MKTYEISVGDWVISSTNEFVKIDCIGCSEYNETRRCDNLPIVVDDEDDRSVGVVSCGQRRSYTEYLGDIKPIPLTEDILIANGFNKAHHPGTGATEEYDDYITNGFLCCHMTEDWKDTYFCIPDTPIQFLYVHELQHILRLCGLNRLADNFVIEVENEKQQMTIEEKAKAFAQVTIPSNNSYADLKLGYTVGATEQDSLARNEERERCIKAAQEAHCKLCGKDADYKCYCLNCLQRTEIRKAIEEGGNK